MKHPAIKDKRRVSDPNIFYLTLAFVGLAMAIYAALAYSLGLWPLT